MMISDWTTKLSKKKVKESLRNILFTWQQMKKRRFKKKNARLVTENKKII